MTRLTDEAIGDIVGDNTMRAGDAYATAWEVESLAREVAERRAADLTDEDRETLKYLRGCAMAETRRTRIPDRDRAFKLIDKLLATKEP